MRVLTTDDIDDRLLCQRRYTCRACGHETVTVGWPLPATTRCYAWIPVYRGDTLITKRRCGGTLRERMVRAGVDISGVTEA